MKNNLPSIKMTVLGESTTGKTSMTYRLVKREFSDSIESTIGASFMTLQYDNVKYEIWDTAGQERYLSLVSMYFRNADLILMVYDMSRPETMERLIYYMKRITEELKNDYRIIVIGNKMDLVIKSEIPYIENLVKEKFSNNGYSSDKIEFMTISTKTGANYELLIDNLKTLGKTLAENKLGTSRENIIKLQDPTNYEYQSDTFKNAYGYCNC
ncbi:Rab-related GTPase protein [Fadolivirus algeromassiliense]|jgi:Ras-related protein Rab-5C|uniref:Rab-related GTPase protein n=1 Tax=Fadolivirus FV1/VV64 TaxID=3070911 RepID=A0A7D3V8Q0_9VIRU|nr:Rab-related GTPase protein [Fadolivirus algeromassiliense]QKF93897.1 Rab-related GTPase protein [Fadolivirus FV1/VV64]